MQTFLPYSSFLKSAQCLDNKRLGKQRVETRQILECLLKDKPGWKNHPAIKMWKNYESYLIKYGLEICLEWRNRGFKDNQFDIIYSFNDLIPQTQNKKPFWLGEEKFHSLHRATLLYKSYDWYKQFNWIELPKYEYWWPV